ncbi:MAG: hypothetical protein K9L61_00845 [Candidatus Omnitrophica bacterium]|nr:hypothetical protein [Candidatus Omnitrophota bacterium]
MHLTLYQKESIDFKPLIKVDEHIFTDSKNMLNINHSVVSAKEIKPWNSKTKYRIGDVIVFDDMFFECIKPGMSGQEIPDFNLLTACVAFEGSIFFCKKKHKSTYYNKPKTGKNWKQFWEKADISHLWNTRWRNNRLYRPTYFIADGNYVRWVKRFKTANIFVCDLKKNIKKIFQISIVSWPINHKALKMLQSNSFMRRSHINKQFYRIRFNKYSIFNRFRRIFSKIILRNSLQLLAIDNISNKNIFYVRGGTRFTSKNIYKIEGDIKNKPQFLAKFNGVPLKVKITPFGYFLIVRDKRDVSKPEKVFVSYDMVNWELSYTLCEKGNYTLQQGWDFEYDGSTSMGKLYLNEKNNLFPIKPAVISVGVFKNKMERLAFDAQGKQKQSDKNSYASWRIAYKFPLQTDIVKVNISNREFFFKCKKSHKSSIATKPYLGQQWQLYWEEVDSAKDILFWKNNHVYASQIDRPKTRHLHSLQKDPYSDLIIIGTGDLDDESHLFYHRNKLEIDKKTGVVKLGLIGSGSQKWRTTGVAFTKNYIYWGMDSQYCKQEIFRIRKKDIKGGFSKKTPFIKTQSIGMFPDKSFLSSFCFLKNDVFYIFFSSGYEVSKYNIDNRARVFCIKEYRGGNYEIMEVFSCPALVDSFGKFIPICIDDNYNIYFNTFLLDIIPENQIIKSCVMI